jgi:hypothetical protein
MDHEPSLFQQCDRETERERALSVGGGRIAARPFCGGARRGKIHSTHGGRKARLGFELKDRRSPAAAALWAVLDFKIQTRSGQPCDEWEGAAQAAPSDTDLER